EQLLLDHKTGGSKDAKDLRLFSLRAKLCFRLGRLRNSKDVGWLLETFEDGKKLVRLRNVAVPSEICQVHLTNKLRDPDLRLIPPRGARRQKGFSGKCGRFPQGNLEVSAYARQVPPHVAPFGGVEIERRIIPPLRLENWTKQEWPPRHF